MTEDERLYWLAAQDFHEALADMKEVKMFTWQKLKDFIRMLTPEELEKEVLVANPSRKLHHADYASIVQTEDSNFPEGVIYINVSKERNRYWYVEKKQTIYLCRGVKSVSEYMKLLKNDSSGAGNIHIVNRWRRETSTWRNWPTLQHWRELERYLEEIGPSEAESILSLVGTTRKLEL